VKTCFAVTPLFLLAVILAEPAAGAESPPRATPQLEALIKPGG
jgi:hypothetical protein